MQLRLHGPRWSRVQGVRCGGLQGHERLSRVHAMLTGQVQYSDGRHRAGHMPGLSFVHVLGCRERTADQLYMQQRLHGAGWRGMRGVYRGQVQGREWLVTVLAVQSGQVLDRDGRDLRGDMQRLSRAHVLWGRQQHSVELYMQQRIHGPRWSRVHGVRCGDLQGHERLSRLHAMLTGQVQYSDGRHRPGYMPGLSRAHVLRYRERTPDQLYVQQRLHGA